MYRVELVVLTVLLLEVVVVSANPVKVGVISMRISNPNYLWVAIDPVPHLQISKFIVLIVYKQHSNKTISSYNSWNIWKYWRKRLLKWNLKLEKHKMRGISIRQSIRNRILWFRVWEIRNRHSPCNWLMFHQLNRHSSTNISRKSSYWRVCKLLFVPYLWV